MAVAKDWDEFDFYYGQSINLVTNGDFSNGIDGWVNSRDGQSTLSYGDGCLIVNPTSSNAFGASTQIPQLEVGKSYKVKATIRSNRDGIVMRLRIWKDKELSSTFYRNDSTTSILMVDDIVEVTTPDMIYIGTIVTGASPGDWVEIDNVSIEPA